MQANVLLNICHDFVQILILQYKLHIDLYIGLSKIVAKINNDKYHKNYSKLIFLLYLNSILFVMYLYLAINKNQNRVF